MAKIAGILFYVVGGGRQRFPGWNRQKIKFIVNYGFLSHEGSSSGAGVMFEEQVAASFARSTSQSGTRKPEPEDAAHTTSVA